MDQIKKQIARVQFRLNFNRFLHLVSWCVFGSLLLAATTYLVRLYWGGGSPAELQYFALAGVGVGLLAGAILAFIHRPQTLDAALELDRRFQLKERVSSSLSLTEEERDSEAGQALLNDAVHRVERIEVSEEFHVEGVSRLTLPLLAAAVFALTILAPLPSDEDNQARASEKKLQEQIRKPAENLKKKLKERREAAIEKGLTDASKLLQKVSSDLDKVTKDGVKKKDALVQMNDIAKDIAERRKALGSAKDMKKKLEGLKNIKKGPADKMFKAMEESDFNSAMGAMQDLKDKLANGDLSEQEQKDLADQLQQMRDKMDQMQRKREQEMSDLREQIKQRQRAGDIEGAEQLQQQLDQMAEQQSSMGQMMQMADKLGQAAENLQSGESEMAMENLDDIMDQLDSMQQQLDELEELDNLMDDLNGAKKMMSGQYGSGDGDQMPGQGMGDGQGMGERPEEESDTGSFDSHVRGKIQKGAAVKTGTARGPNRKGLSREEVKEEIQMSISERAEAVNEQKRLPKDQRDHLREYFQLFEDN